MFMPWRTLCVTQYDIDPFSYTTRHITKYMEKMTNTQFVTQCDKDASSMVRDRYGPIYTAGKP